MERRRKTLWEQIGDTIVELRYLGGLWEASYYANHHVAQFHWSTRAVAYREYRKFIARAKRDVTGRGRVEQD